ncbi:MAG: branched-chain amino acid ABC transporter permease [Anaerolineales bacterium]
MNSKSRFTTWLLSNLTLIIIVVPLVLLALGVSLFGGPLLERITIVLFINLALVLGLEVFNGNSGVLSFAQIGFMGIGAYASILFTMTPQIKAVALPNLYAALANVQLPFLPALLIGAIIAALVAAIIGFPLMRLSGAASVIATFALLVIIHRVLINWDEVTNGARTIFGIERFTTLEISAIFGITFVFLAYWFRETPLGLKLRASREDEHAAASIGINKVIARWVAFILSAAMTGVAGVLWAHFITSFSPISFYLKQTFLIITMLIIGGIGSVSGAVVGTLAVTAIFEGMRGIENAISLSDVIPFTASGLTEVVLSVALIAILILRPAGITGGREFHWPRKQIRSAVTPDPADQSQ